MPEVNAQDAVFRFSVFEADLRSGELRKNGVKVRVQDLPFRALTFLLTHPNQVLSREEFRKALWPDGVFVDFDHGINSAINRLRDALGDSADTPHFIETVERRGYRWIAPILSADPPVPAKFVPDQEASAQPAQVAPDRVAENPTAATRHPFSWRSKWIWALPILALLLVALDFRPTHRSAKANNESAENAAFAPIRSVAVLPLQNFSNDPSQEYFVDGMTDELITDLAQIRELKVVSRTSIMQYKGTHSSLPQIGKELGVDAVVEGSVLRSGDRVRITAQLIRSATDRHIWAQSYDGDTKDILSLQARVAEAITNQVKLSLTAEESGRLRRNHPVDPEALDLYLRGRYAWNQRNLAGFKQGIEYFQQAIARDPKYAEAYAGLADCYMLTGLYGQLQPAIDEAQKAAEQALALDDTLADAHTSLGAYKVLHDFDLKSAEQEFRRALELDPNSSQAHHWYGNLMLDPAGRVDEAIAEIQRAQQLDPLSVIIETDLGYAYYLAGKNDLAFQTYQKIAVAHPDFVPVHFYLMQYYSYIGQYDSAVKEDIEATRLAGHLQLAQFIQQTYDRGGYRAVRQASLRPNKFLPITTCNALMPDLLLGQKNKALDNLEKCYQERGRAAYLYVKVDPALNPLHSEPRYQTLLRRLDLE
jgi:TolB-like protein/DNA-binding winged helix-turn-helix (wHTH) protein